MGDSLQHRRTVVMTAARHLAIALRDLPPEDSTDLDIAASVLKAVHEEFGPGHWAQSQPAEYVLAVQQLAPSCRAFSTPSDWYESLQSGVAALETTQQRPATLADIGRVLHESENTQREQLARLMERFALNCCIEGMLSDVDAPAVELTPLTIAAMHKHIPNVQNVPALTDPNTVGRLVSALADGLRLSVARSISLILSESASASNDEIVGTATQLLLRTHRRLQTMDRDVVVGFVAHVSNVFAAACRSHGDPTAWYAMMQRFAADGGWRTRRR